MAIAAATCLLTSHLRASMAWHIAGSSGHAGSPDVLQQHRNGITALDRIADAEGQPGELDALVSEADHDVVLVVSVGAFRAVYPVHRVDLQPTVLRSRT